jgi:hypothetical protein
VRQDTRNDMHRTISNISSTLDVFQDDKLPLNTQASLNICLIYRAELVFQRERSDEWKFSQYSRAISKECTFDTSQLPMLPSNDEHLPKVANMLVTRLTFQPLKSPPTKFGVFVKSQSKEVTLSTEKPVTSPENALALLN